jgi:hypothetical protein
VEYHSSDTDSPPLRSNFDPIWRAPWLRAEPSWWDYVRLHLDREGVCEQAGQRRASFLRSAQIGKFALYLPFGFEFFAGQQVWMGITDYSALPSGTADRLALDLARGGVRVPKASFRFRAVGRKGCVFFVVEPAQGDEPSLPAEWLTSWEIAGVDHLRPWWVGSRRRASKSHGTTSQSEASMRLEQIDWSLYEERDYGWKLSDSPPLPEAFSGPMK